MSETSWKNPEYVASIVERLSFLQETVAIEAHRLSVILKQPLDEERDVQALIRSFKADSANVAFEEGLALAAIQRFSSVHAIASAFTGSASLASAASILNSLTDSIHTAVSILDESDLSDLNDELAGVFEHISRGYQELASARQADADLIRLYRPPEANEENST